MKNTHNTYMSIPVYTLLVVLCSLGLLLSSCGSDSSTGPGENGGNDDDQPAEPTYANVQSIFNSSCATSGCHDAATSSSGVNLSDYESIINSVGVQYGEKVVQPGDADGSPLVDKIEPNPDTGARMPQGRSPLSDEQISLIRQWINEGAEENSGSSNDSGGDY